MLKILIVALALTSSLVSAKDIQILKITNQEDKKISYFSVEVDEHLEIIAFSKTSFLKGKEVEKVVFPGELSYAGEVLEVRKGRDIVILRGLNVDTSNGGAIEIDFLYNGITGSRGKLLLDLERTSDSWQVTSKGKIAKHLHLITNSKMFVGNIGIKEIQIK
jgi:hypothetical protein